MRLRTILLLVIALLLAAPAAAAASCANADADPEHVSPRSVRAAVLCLVNEQRAAHGVRALSPNRKLNRSARRYALQMAEKRFFSHTGLTGEAPAARVAAAGYRPSSGRWTIGENLAWGVHGVDETPRQTVIKWMNSPSHKHVLLLGVFKSIGIGIATPNPKGGRGTTYVTHFAS
jgi:uncharacterized protein YkwD